MAFYKSSISSNILFNSANSSDFLDRYERYSELRLIQKSLEPGHKTFAPSSFRCNRRSWFRLRGVEPDVLDKPDKVLEFSAVVGTACHNMIQHNLVDMLGSNWLDVESYVKSINSPYTFSFTPSAGSIETKVECTDPPVLFACDGILRFKDKIYLLEIKSCEYSVWMGLANPKSGHLDQVKCYCTLLGLSDVMFMYIDRQFGNIKCFEYSVSEEDKIAIRKRFEYVQKMVELNLAPDPIPPGDIWCSPSYCPYYKKCREYGK